MADIPGLEDLRREWEKVFGLPPSPAARREFLLGNLAYERQTKAEGGLGLRITKELAAVAAGAKPRSGHEVVVKPGSKFIRMWKGEPHEVTVLGGGRYQYREAVYPSLSAIANLVTGTKWNGKLFFGLKKDPRRA